MIIVIKFLFSSLNFLNLYVESKDTCNSYFYAEWIDATYQYKIYWFNVIGTDNLENSTNPQTHSISLDDEGIGWLSDWEDFKFTLHSLVFQEDNNIVHNVKQPRNFDNRK